MLKVMLVDDKAAIVKGLECFIDWGSLGYEIAATATSANEAIEIVRNNEIDLILTDIKMPDMDGIEMIEELMSFRTGIKYILLSAYSEFEYAKRAVDKQISGYILKPINEQELIDVLKRVKNEIEKEKKYATLITKENSMLSDSVDEADDAKQINLQSGIIKKVIEYAENHYSDNDLNLNYLASILFVTPSYLGRVFKKNTGESFSDFLLKIRMNKARQLLKTTEVPIYEVARLVGFSDANYFCMKFQTIVGMTATHYRKTKTSDK